MRDLPANSCDGCTYGGWATPTRATLRSSPPACANADSVGWYRTEQSKRQHDHAGGEMEAGKAARLRGSLPRSSYESPWTANS